MASMMLSVIQGLFMGLRLVSLGFLSLQCVSMASLKVLKKFSKLGVSGPFKTSALDSRSSIKESTLVFEKLYC